MWKHDPKDYEKLWTAESRAGSAATTRSKRKGPLPEFRSRQVVNTLTFPRLNFVNKSKPQLSTLDDSLKHAKDCWRKKDTSSKLKAHSRCLTLSDESMIRLVSITNEVQALPCTQFRCKHSGLLQVLVPPIVPERDPLKAIFAPPPVEPKAKEPTDKFPLVPKLSDESREIMYLQDWENLDFSDIMDADEQETLKLKMHHDENYYLLYNVFITYGVGGVNITEMATSELLRFMKEVNAICPNCPSSLIVGMLTHINTREENCAELTTKMSTTESKNNLYDLREFKIAIIYFACALFRTKYVSSRPGTSFIADPAETSRRSSTAGLQADNKHKIAPHVALQRFLAEHVKPVCEQIGIRDLGSFRAMLKSEKMSKGPLYHLVVSSWPLLRLNLYKVFSNLDEQNNRQDGQISVSEMKRFDKKFRIVDEMTSIREFYTCILLSRNENRLNDRIFFKYDSFLEFCLRMAALKYGTMELQALALGVASLDASNTIKKPTSTIEGCAELFFKHLSLSV